MHEGHKTLSPGAIIRDRYLIVDLLGSGGFSAVYLVGDLQGEERFYALKETILVHKHAKEHFTFEYSLLERLKHPALPRVHSVFDNEEHSRLYMLMDYIEGPNLETLRLIQHEKCFSLPVITSILAPVVDAIEYLHQQDPPIVHRDIKPSNMIVAMAGRQTLLVDFGIAKEYDTQGTTNAVRYGSRGYGAPEQYSSGTNTRTDIYGLAATLYTLLTSELPADALDRMTQLSNDYPDPLKPPHELNPSIPIYASRAIKQALAINMMQRFATVGEFWQALQLQPVQSPLAPEVFTAKTVLPLSYRAADQTVETTNLEKVQAKQPARFASLILEKLVAINPHQLQVKQVSHTNSRKRFLLPILLVLLLVAGIGASYLGFTVFRGMQATTHTIGKSNPTNHTGTTLATVTATRATNNYPHLATSYQGKIDDLQANVPSQMTLTGISQNNGYIIGTFKALGIIEIFDGSLGTSKQISFFVTDKGNRQQLSFWGGVQPDGELAGQFCAIDQNGQCIPSGVFGLWSVAPLMGNQLASAFYRGIEDTFMKLLVIDTDRDLVEMLTRWLSTLGLTVYSKTARLTPTESKLLHLLVEIRIQCVR